MPELLKCFSRVTLRPRGGVLPSRLLARHPQAARQQSSGSAAVSAAAAHEPILGQIPGQLPGQVPRQPDRSLPPLEESSELLARPAAAPEPLEDRELDAWVGRSAGCNGGLSTGIILEVRSRLYRGQILQVNTRWKALAEIYTMHSFAPFLESIIKNWGKKSLAKTTPKR